LTTGDMREAVLDGDALAQEGSATAALRKLSQAVLKQLVLCDCDGATVAGRSVGAAIAQFAGVTRFGVKLDGGAGAESLGLAGGAVIVRSRMLMSKLDLRKSLPFLAFHGRQMTMPRRCRISSTKGALMYPRSMYKASISRPACERSVPISGAASSSGRLAAVMAHARTRLVSRSVAM